MFLISVSSKKSISSNIIIKNNFSSQKNATAPSNLSAEVQRSQLMVESWYHGSISRDAAERLLQKDGDFLVRDSQGTKGQYVLTGLQIKTPKNLFLLDGEGCVRTKDRLFESISHLINYHWTNALPIISAENIGSALVLRNPVHKVLNGDNSKANVN